MATAEGGHSWPAGIVFGIAGVTDQVDGYLARRWQVESDFGRIFDPLADRLMIDAAVILLFIQDHMPWEGVLVIVGRDVLLLAGYKAIAPKGYELNVSLLGKAADLAALRWVSAACSSRTGRPTGPTGSSRPVSCSRWSQPWCTRPAPGKRLRR